MEYESSGHESININLNLNIVVCKSYDAFSQIGNNFQMVTNIPTEIEHYKIVVGQQMEIMLLRIIIIWY